MYITPFFKNITIYVILIIFHKTQEKYDNVR